MSIRAKRLAPFLVLLVVVAAGGSLALNGSTTAPERAHRISTVCLIARAPGHEKACPVRTADLHCHCCGTDENGHCNHQCCD
jgi:hypothetical protein